MIQASKLGARIMRYELADHEWIAIKPMLPNKPRGVPRVNDRRVLNGIFWVLRSGAPWRDLPEMFGPYTTCYNRFVRWRPYADFAPPSLSRQVAQVGRSIWNRSLERAYQPLPCMRAIRRSACVSM